MSWSFPKGTRLSGYGEWLENETDGDFYINTDNIGRCPRGTNSDDIISRLIHAMGKPVRRRGKEVTCDLSSSMMLIAGEVFPSAYVVNDHFHVLQVYNEAVDEIRIDIRRELIKKENKEKEENLLPKSPEKYSNGETMRQILTRSKYILMMSKYKWTDIQRHRGNILFKHYPILKEAYNLEMELRRIFNKKMIPEEALVLMNKWYEKVSALDNSNFRSSILYSARTQKNRVKHLRQLRPKAGGARVTGRRRAPAPSSAKPRCVEPPCDRESTARGRASSRSPTSSLHNAAYSGFWGQRFS